MSFLDGITPDSVKKINDGIQSILDPVNPFITDLTEDNKKIAKHLLEEGISVEAIQKFVDVSRTQLDPFLALESEVMKRVAEATKPKAK